MAAVLTDTNIAPRSRFVKQTGRRFCSPSPGGVKRSPAADAGLGCSKNRPLSPRTGGSGGHFALGVMAPRRPFCPLSAGGKWTISPQNRFCGVPGPLDRLWSPAFADSRRPTPHSRRGLLGRCARRRGSFRSSRSIITVSPFLYAAYNPSVKPFGFASSPYTGEPSPAGASRSGSQALAAGRAEVQPFLSYSIRATALHKISAERCAAFCSNWS